MNRLVVSSAMLLLVALSSDAARAQSLGTARSARNATPVAANQPTALEFQRTLEAVLERLEQSEQRLLQSEQRIKELESELIQQKRPSQAAVKQSSHYELTKDEIMQAVDARLANYTRPAAQADAAPRQFESGYDKGFFIRPTDDAEGIPFDLLVKGRMQFRHTGFKSDDENFLKDRNDFEIERGRLVFRGHFIDPRLSFFINIDSDTDENHDMRFHDFALNWKHSEAVTISVGKLKVPGSRDWLWSSKVLRFVDRSMATTFFRPDRTTGVWVHGKPTEKTYYQVMVGNGYTTTDLSQLQFDDQFGVAATTYWDVIGDYGNGVSDLECHETPAVRIGNSLTFTDIDPTSAPGEQRVFRLVDRGTRLVDAFPGATRGFDVWMYAVDAGLKYQGFSVNAEWFMRWIQDFESSFGVPSNDLFDYGFFAEAGYFIVPKQVELIGRVSRVNSDGGSPSADEYGAGVNYYVKGHDLKVTFDVNFLNGNPSSNSGPGYRPGMDGVLFRTQLETGF